MSHKVLVDTAVQSYLDSLFQNLTQQQIQTGVIIGQRSSAHDLIFNAFPTAIKDGQDENKIDEDWILEHAYQVSRMLCGGQFILGLFFHTTTAKYNQLTGTFQHILTQLTKQNQAAINNLQLEEKNELSNVYRDMLLFHLASDTKKLSCKLFNFEESKVNIKATELKVRSVLNDIHLLSSNWSVEVNMPIMKGPILKEQIQAKLMTECNMIASAFVIENGQPINTDELIVPQNEDKKKNKQGAKKGNKKKEDKNFSGSIPVHAVELLTNQFEASPIATDISSSTNSANNNKNNAQETVGSVQIRGQIAGKAYVNIKESWATAIKYLKLDLARSVQTRFELLNETLEALEDEEKKENSNSPYFNPLPIAATNVNDHIWLLPRRVFTESNSMWFSDYISSVDTIEDCIERFDAMLAIKTESAKLEQSENFRGDVPLDSELMWSNKSVKKSAKKQPSSTTKTTANKNGADQEPINESNTRASAGASLTGVTDGQVSAARPHQQRNRLSMAIIVLIVALTLARLVF